jgi:dolichol-phosphate mannosyltransferase
MKINVGLTVIVTAYNEEKNIFNCITMLDHFLNENLESYQIIVVDDGSSDLTIDNFSLIPTKKDIELIRMGQNQGVGACIKKAFPQITESWFCWFPSDLEFLPNELLKPLAQCRDNDIVVTHALNARMVRSHFRYYLSTAFNIILNISFSKKIKYYNGITLYKKSAATNLRIKSNRFFFHAELLLRNINNKTKLSEVSIILTPRYEGVSSAIRYTVLKDIVFCYLNVLWELKIKKYECINN